MVPHMKSKFRTYLLPIIIFQVFFAGMAYVQFSTPDLPGNDGFYHIRMAWLMRTQGLKPDFDDGIPKVLLQRHS